MMDFAKIIQAPVFLMRFKTLLAEVLAAFNGTAVATGIAFATGIDDLDLDFNFDAIVYTIVLYNFLKLFF